MLLCGAIGVGKSTVLLAIGDVLEARDDPYALVDLDWLAWVRPAPGASLDVGKILATNLAAACRPSGRQGHPVVATTHLAPWCASCASYDTLSSECCDV